MFGSPNPAALPCKRKRQRESSSGGNGSQDAKSDEGNENEGEQRSDKFWDRRSGHKDRKRRDGTEGHKSKSKAINGTDYGDISADNANGGDAPYHAPSHAQLGIVNSISSLLDDVPTPSTAAMSVSPSPAAPSSMGAKDGEDEEKIGENSSSKRKKLRNEDKDRKRRGGTEGHKNKSKLTNGTARGRLLFSRLKRGNHKEEKRNLHHLRILRDEVADQDGDRPPLPTVAVSETLQDVEREIAKTKLAASKIEAVPEKRRTERQESRLDSYIKTLASLRKHMERLMENAVQPAPSPSCWPIGKFDLVSLC